MKKLINILIISFIVISTVINLYYINNLDRLVQERIELLDVEPEIVFVDTVKFDTVYFNHFDTVKLETIKKDTILDSIFVLDSVEVFIPINTYKFDTTLNETVVSFDLRGFNCEVDNLYLKSMKVSTIEQKAPKKWGVGVGIGITYVDRFRLVPTLGISYNLFSF